MGIVFRQSVKTTIVIATGAVLGALVVYLSTHFVPKQERGFTNNLTNQALVAGQILIFGFHGTLAVYIHRYDNDERKRKALIGFCLLLPFLLFVLFSAAYFLGKDWLLHHFQAADIPFLKRYFAWMPLFTMFFIYQILLESYLSSQLKVALSSFLKEIVLRILNIFFILLFGLHYISFDALVAAIVLVYLVPIAFLVFFSSKQKTFGISFDTNAFSRREYRELLHFTWYHALLGISVNLLGYLDQLTLAPLDRNGLTSLAVYNVSVYIISVLLIPYKAMSAATFPVLTRAFRDNDNKKVHDVFTRSSINILIATTLLAALICCNLQNAVLIINNGYDAIRPIALILLLGRMVDIATGMNDQVLSISKFYKANFYFSVVLVVMVIILYRLFIPLYGMYGAAWSTTIALALYNIIKYAYVWKKLQLQPFTAGTLYVMISGIMAIVIGYFLPQMTNPFIDTIYRSAIIALSYFIMIYWLKPSDDLRQYISSIKKQKRLF